VLKYIRGSWAFLALSVLPSQRPPGTYPQWDEMSLTLIAVRQSARYGIMWGLSEEILELTVDLELLLNDFGEVLRKEGFTLDWLLPENRGNSPGKINSDKDKAAAGKEAQSLTSAGKRQCLVFCVWHSDPVLSVLRHYKMFLFCLILSWSQYNLVYWCSEKLFMSSF